MEVVLRYRGRAVTPVEVEFIRQFIAGHPGAHRRRLSELLCVTRNWRQENGELKAMLCRELMLALHRASHIEFPPLRRESRTPWQTDSDRKRLR